MPALVACLACADGSPPLGAQPPLSPTNEAERMAVSALSAGRPLAAQRALQSRLATPASRTPGTLLLAADAAVARDQHADAVRLLQDAPWLDTLGGRPHRTLAWAALSHAPRSARLDSLAARHAARAVSLARGAEQGVRRVLLARALERLRDDDAAAAAYREAARSLPTIRRWLLLRAASITESAGARRTTLREVRELRDERGDERPGGDGERAWEDRAHAADVAARLRYDDTTGAIAAAQARGTSADSLQALGWLLALGGDSLAPARPLHRARLLAWIAAPDDALAVRAVEVLDRHFTPLARGEELLVARRLGRGVNAPRARRAYARVLQMVPSSARSGAPASEGRPPSATPATSDDEITGDDRVTYGVLLQQAGSHGEASAQFARVTTGPRAGIAAYQRARSTLRTAGATRARAMLRAVTTQFAHDDEAAGLAWYLLGDLAIDARDEAAARAAWRTLATRLPQHRLASTAAFRAAILSLAAGDSVRALTEFRELAARDGSERRAAQYWTARLQAAHGAREPARRLWLQLLRDAPESYYAWRAAEQLDTVPWSGDSGVAAAVGAGADAARANRLAARIALLDSLGLTPEASIERAWLQDVPRADGSAARAAAEAFRRLDRASPAIRLAVQAGDAGTRRDAAFYRLLFPFPFAALIREQAAARALDPLLVAALIRQESRFTPSARSAADARGLMQVLPSVARALAPVVGAGPWNDRLLEHPETNVLIGMRQLATVLAQAPGNHPAYALAAYNAGPTRLRRWRTWRGTGDWELFVERIPYEETRDYVRIVLRNREWYRALYANDG